MRKLILVAVIFQLAVIIIGSNGYKFGDIISFKRGGVLYKHFAIYVGNEPIDGEEHRGRDIFHFTKPDGKGKRKCIFGVLSETGKPTVENYLDGKDLKNGQKMEKGSDEEIKGRIKAMMEPDTCKKYNLLKNNCEHLATAVRYGWSVSKQGGTFVGIFLKLKKPKEKIALNQAVLREIYEGYSGCAAEAA